jgi:hypothetical protein
MRLLTQQEMDLKNKLKKHSLALASFKRTIARSRSRIEWLREGGANTRFFHLQARKGKNFIHRLAADNEICTNHDEKAKLIHEFYEGLLGTNWNRKHTIDLQALGIPTHDLADLELPFSEKEI